MKFSFFIILVSIGGLGFGLVSAMGTLNQEFESKNFSQIESLDREIDFFGKSISSSIWLNDSSTIQPNSFMPIIQNAQLTDQSQRIIEQATVSFNFGVDKIDPDGLPDSRDEYLSNVVSECIFHSSDDIPFDTCVICKLNWIGEDQTPVPIAQGRVDLPNGYEGSTTLEIPIDELEYPRSNEAAKVEGITIEICSSGTGCTPGYWKQNAKNWGASAWTVEDPSDPLHGFIANHHQSLDDDLLDALEYKGGKGLEGAERNLLRHAVAAKLNIENDNVLYPIESVGVLQTLVETAITDAYAANDRSIMNNLKNTLDENNNLGCSIDADGDPI